MRLLPLALLGTLLTGSAHGQDLPPSEAATLPRLIDSLCIDLHPSNGCEQVILLESESHPDAADLVILTDRRRHEGGGTPLLVLRGAVYNGAMWGMSPSLEETTGRQLLLHSEQSGIGRSPWFQTLRIGWREDGFHLMGFSYSSYDRITSGGYDCDMDYAAGSWTSSAYWVDPESGEETGQETAGGQAGAPPPLTADTAQQMPAPCQAVQELYWQRLP